MYELVVTMLFGPFTTTQSPTYLIPNHSCVVFRFDVCWIIEKKRQKSHQLIPWIGGAKLILQLFHLTTRSLDQI